MTSTPATADPNLVAARLEDWRRRLIDLSYRNRLINYKHRAASTLEVETPGIDALLERMGSTSPWSFYFPPDPDEESTEDESEAALRVDEAVVKAAQRAKKPRPDEIVVKERHPLRINRVLEGLARKSNSEFQDKALRVLYIAAGFLDWVDPARGEQLTSPLVLVPVRLERQSARQPHKLFFVDDEETVINPSLVEKLRHDAGLELPEDFVWEDKPVLTELAEIQAAVQKHGWTVRHDAVIGLFSFQKYVMYRDLLDNQAAAAAHPLVRALAKKELDPEELPEVELSPPESLDEVQPAASTFSILDADASQRVCVEAAKSGQSYVMHGPPGTGKSQTIANVIAEAIGQGKKVLFVSEKAAALDVVYNRLRANGLAEFCLMLHGEHASRREVVNSLFSALTGQLVPRRGLTDDEFELHDRLRRYLNAQVDTLHAPEPLLGDRSIRDVHATLASLFTAPSVPGAPPASAMKSERIREEYQQLDDLFARIAERWHVSPREYVWRSFDAERFSSDDRARVLEMLQDGRRCGLQARQLGEIVAAKLDVPQPASVPDARGLIALGEHLQQAPRLHAAWLDPGWPDSARKAIAVAQETYREWEEKRQRFLSTFAARELTDFRPGLGNALEAALQGLEEAAGRTSAWDDELLARVQSLSTALRDLPRQVEAVSRRVREVADLLGQPDTDPDFDRVAELVSLARLSFEAELRPEQTWLVQAGLDRATRTLAETRERFTTYQEHANRACLEWAEEALALPVDEVVREIDLADRQEQELGETWLPDIVALDDAPELVERFETEYQSSLAKLKGSYRRDAKKLKSLRPDGKLPPDPAEALRPVVELQRRRFKIRHRVASVGLNDIVPNDLRGALAELKELQQKGAAVDATFDATRAAFGSYFDGRDTDLNKVEQAVAVARASIPLRHPDSDMPALTSRLCVGATPDIKVAQGADQLESAAATLAGTLDELRPFVGKSEEVLTGTLEQIRRSVSSLESPMANVELLAEEISRGALTRPRTLQEAREIAANVQRLHETRSEIDRQERGWAQTIGPTFRAENTAWAEVELVADWVEELYRQLDDALTPAIGEQLLDRERTWPDIISFGRLLDEYVELCEQVAHLFSAPRRQEVLELGSSDFEEFDMLCLDLVSQIDSLYDWTDFAHFHRLLTEAGWEEFVAKLAEAEIGPEDVGRAYRLAYWNRRLEALFNEDPDLEADFRGGAYGRFVEQFRQLDRQLIRSGADRLIGERNRTRRRHVAVDGSEVSVLRHEAGKIKRHKPVRRLLAEIPSLLSELKPCLMMSPLSVSHFLTPKHLFDLVIFDEASQVPPQDAINCIYRGKQLIVAGDAKQLPPTSFFQVAETDEPAAEDLETEEDMESVLDACQALLPNHPLTWHYRSRHEDLIGFSNREIYEGRLVTFPTPDHLSDELGVSFVYVPDGVYDRGRTQTNRREAQIVAQRVVHYLTDGMKRSVGVIAFNTAQANAIAEELDLLRLEDPSLEQYFSGDRLDGPFVKHLESVQGDERDVIIFSVGYGRDEDGKFTMNFGPLNKAGGHRRLNVAVTRARQKVEVVSSVRGADFTLTERSSRGARLLREYLEYAERSASTARAEELGDDDHHAISELEREIARAIEELGYRAVHQVGTGFLRVDIGVLDPREPERFVLGVESDGRGYADTPTARDRERLRGEVLKGLGWRIHRVSSLDWVRDRATEVKRLGEALEGADRVAADDPATNEHLSHLDDAHVHDHEREREEVPLFDLRDPASLDHLPWVEPYTRQEVGFEYSNLGFHEPQNRRKQIEVAKQVLRTEAPAHVEYLVRRIAEAWDVHRVGTRVDAAARQAISQAAREANFTRKGQFYWGADQELTHVRCPAPGDPRTRREIDTIPGAEIELAFRRLLEAAGDANDDVLIGAVARILGFERVGERIRSPLKRRLRNVRKGEFE